MDENENLSSEVSEIVSEVKSSEIPSKFKGKSPDEIVEAYVNLEKELGRKGQEIGELRKLTDQLLQRELAPPPTPRPVETKEEDVDFFDDPKKAVKTMLEQELRPVKDKLVQSGRETTVAKLNSTFPEWKETVGSTEFKEWVAKSKVRTALYRAADQAFDYDAASELLSTYNDVSAVQKNKDKAEEVTAKQKEALKAAKMESSNSTGQSSKKVFKRADLMELRINEPDKYMRLWPEIEKAYREKRVR